MSQMYDMAIGFSVANLNYFLRQLYTGRNRVLDTKIKIRDAGEVIDTGLADLKVSIRLASTMVDSVRLEIGLAQVTLNGEPVATGLTLNNQFQPSGKWHLSLKVPLKLDKIRPRDWDVHEKISRSARRKLNQFRDETLYMVKCLSFDFSEIEIGAALQRNESNLPPLLPEQEKSIFRLLGIYLRRFIGLKNPFNFAFQVLSKDSTNTFIGNPDFVPTYVDWGVLKTLGAPETDQLRLLIMTNNRKPPPLTQYPHWISTNRNHPEVGGELVISEALLLQRTICSQVKEALGFTESFAKAGQEYVVYLGSEQREKITKTITTEGPHLFDVAFTINQDTLISVGYEFNPNAERGKRMAIVLTGKHTRSLESRFRPHNATSDWFNSKLLQSTAIYHRKAFLSVTDGILSGELDLSFNIEISGESQKHLSRWRESPADIVHYALVRDFEALLTKHYNQDGFRFFRVKLALPSAPWIMPDGTWYSYLDPSVFASESMMGSINALRLQLSKKN